MSEFRFPLLPKGQRWKVADTGIGGYYVKVSIQQKGWLFWHEIASTALYKENAVNWWDLEDAMLRLMKNPKTIAQKGAERDRARADAKKRLEARIPYGTH